MRKTLAAFLLTILFVPALCGAATQASKDYEDQGLALFNRGLYAKSIDYFQDAVQADPSNWQAYEDLGNAYAQTNQNAQAIDAYQRSLQGNPNNPTVKEAITNLGGNPNAAPTGPAPQAGNPPPSNQGYNQGQPDEEVVVGRRGRRRRVAEPEPVYKDNLAPINHSKFWLSGELFYNYSAQTDLVNSANSLNSYIKTNGLTGIANAYNDGIGAGAEFGFMLNPYNGLAIGIRGIQTNNYTSNVNFQNGPPSDYETINLTPYVVPLTLDYYLFLPDHDGRFFLTGGVGYYFVDVTGDDSYSTGNQTGGDEYLGNMYGGSVGFQLGIGREFEINRHFALRLFARGHYAKVTNINGTFTSANGITDQYGLVDFAASQGGYIGIDSTSNINANGEKYATLDYTGFDVGVGLTFF